MCGIIFYQNTGPILRKKSDFYQAANLLYNRGPDHQNYIIKKNRMIFHSRLKIIDLHNRSAQPMRRNNFSIIYNGEIYNYLELKNELKNFYHFTTNSDTEVLLFSFIHWGKKMLNKIEGMYSFVIFEENTNYYFAARDFFGQKPLYYFKKNSEIFFSSEIKPILKFFKLTINFEDKEIYKYLNNNYFGDSKNTFFRNIFQVTPGTYCEYKNLKLQFKKYEITPNKKIIERSIKSELVNSVKKNLISDVEVALLYSGGVDSRSIYDLLPKNKKKKIKLFHLNFEDFSEIRNTSNLKNLKSFTFKKKDFFFNLNRCSKICESPPLSLFSLGYLKLFGSIKKNKIKVVLNGQGIDENFGGYNSLFNKLTKSKIFHPNGDILLNGSNFFKKKFVNDSKKNILKKKYDLLKKTKIPKNLIQIDKLSMNFSLECRTPYLTNSIFKNTFNLSRKNMKGTKNNKYLFRKILYSITKNNDYFIKKNYKQSPQEEYLRDKKIFSKIKEIIGKKNYCDKYFNKKNLKNYLSKFEKNQNNGFLIWQYISLNSFIKAFKKI